MELKSFQTRGSRTSGVWLPRSTLRRLSSTTESQRRRVVPDVKVSVTKVQGIIRYLHTKKLYVLR